MKKQLLFGLVVAWTGLIPAAATGAGTVAFPGAGPLVAACRMVKQPYACVQNQQRCWMVRKCRPWRECKLTPQGRQCYVTRRCWNVRECKLVPVRTTCWRWVRVCDSQPGQQQSNRRMFCSQRYQACINICNSRYSGDVRRSCFQRCAQGFNWCLRQ